MSPRRRSAAARVGAALLAVGIVIGTVIGLAVAPASAARSVTATLVASAARAPVGTEVPVTLTVAPRSVADVSTPRGRTVRVQVLNQFGRWQTIDTYRLPRTGVLRTTVTGVVPGYTGQYRAVVVRLNSPRALVTSNTVGIFWLNADGTEPITPAAGRP